MKDPLIAALLNLSFSGAGYLYVGERRLFARLIFSGFICTTMSAGIYLLLFFSKSTVVELLPAGMLEMAAIIPTLLTFVAMILIGSGFAIDGYNEAKWQNKRYLAKVRKNR
jgi:hypothetical protein